MHTTPCARRKPPHPALKSAWAPVLVGCVSLSPAYAEGPIRMAVAANMASTAEAICQSWQALHKSSPCLISSGASLALAAQIRKGLPVHIFVSADLDAPKSLIQEGLAQQNTLFTYAQGQLVLWSPNAQAVDTEGACLKNPSLHRLALANPKTAPYGAAAESALRSLQLWDTLLPRLVYGESIAQAWQFAASGNAEMAFVGWSQVKDSEGSHWKIPQKHYPPLLQGAVVLQMGAALPEVQSFWRHFQSDSVKDTLKKAGYLIPR